TAPVPLIVFAGPVWPGVSYGSRRPGGSGPAATLTTAGPRPHPTPARRAGTRARPAPPAPSAPGSFPPDLRRRPARNHSPTSPSQTPQRHHRQRRVVVPAHPPPRLVLVQPTLAFAALNRLLDRPAPRADRCQRGERHLGRGVSPVVLQLRLLA